MLTGTTNLNTLTNLLYVLADVQETLLLDLEAAMRREGYALRHETKRDFTAAIAAIRRLKRDVDHTRPGVQEAFGDDADMMAAFIKLLVDRCGDDDRRFFEFYCYVKRFPSKLGLELADERTAFGELLQGKEETK